MTLFSLSYNFFESLHSQYSGFCGKVFPGFLTPALTQVFVAKPLTTYVTCIGCERRKITLKNVCLNQVSNRQLPGHLSDICYLLRKQAGLLTLSGFSIFYIIQHLNVAELLNA